MSESHPIVEVFGQKERCYKCDMPSDFEAFAWTDEIHCAKLWCCRLHFLMLKNEDRLTTLHQMSKFLWFGFRRIFVS